MIILIMNKKHLVRVLEYYVWPCVPSTINMYSVEWNQVHLHNHNFKILTIYYCALIFLMEFMVYILLNILCD